MYGRTVAMLSQQEPSYIERRWRSLESSRIENLRFLSMNVGAVVMGSFVSLQQMLEGHSGEWRFDTGVGAAAAGLGLAIWNERELRENKRNMAAIEQEFTED